MSKNNGGPAFPTKTKVILRRQDVYGPLATGSEVDYVTYPGMTLRDYFAAKAMQGLIAINNEYIEVIAGKAYRMADAMLAEREKDNEVQN